MDQHTFKGLLDVTQTELKELFSIKGNPEGKTKALLLFVGLILTPITLLGALLYYKKGFRLFMEPNNELPRLSNLSPIVRVGMIIGAILIWAIIYVTALVMIRLILWVGGDFVQYNQSFVPVFLFVNIVFTSVVWLWFTRWRGGIFKYVSEKKRHGSARFAIEKEKLPYRKPEGFYIGFDTFYKKAGHLLTVAGTRAGKGVNLILQNLLMPNLFSGSIVCFDPKGENCAISKRISEAAGKKIVALNSWDILGLGNTSFNCLDILNHDRINLSDDVQLIAECIIPVDQNSKDSHFEDKARAYLAGLILHLVTSAPEKDRHLGKIWEWLRYNQEEWNFLIADMMLNNDPNVGDIVRATANEIAGLMKTSDREYGSVISSAQRHTDFIKSPALRDSLISSPEFHPADLANGNIALFLIIPADRLKSHSAYLRLVITSLLRSAVRNQGKDILFLIDEAYAMGYNAELELALGAYAGFGIHIWTVWQSLVQLQGLYPKTWENFIACCSVRHFFNISDNFSAEYLSKMFGQTSVPEYDDKGQIKGASPRPLVTPDELRRESGDTIYTVIDQLPPAQIPKVPYYTMGLDCDPNPYYKPEKKEDDTIPSLINVLRRPKMEQHILK